MKLQLALDEMKTEEAVKLVEKVEDYIDIIEIGTPICLDAGNDAVARLKKEFPDKEVLADCKIMDGGYLEAISCRYDHNRRYPSQSCRIRRNRS